MRKDIEARVFEEANYFLKCNTTVRKMCGIFGVSKSTIHYDLAVRLKKINTNLFAKVDKILKYNLSQRHIRGGESTKLKYKKLKNKNN